MDGSWFWVISVIPLIGAGFYIIGNGRFGSIIEAEEDFELHREAAGEALEDGDQVANIEIVWKEGE